MTRDRQPVWPVVIPWIVVGIVLLGAIALAIAYSPLLARSIFRRDAPPPPEPPSGVVENAPGPDNTITQAPDLPAYPGPDNDITSSPREQPQEDEQ